LFTETFFTAIPFSLTFAFSFTYIDITISQTGDINLTRTCRHYNSVTTTRKIDTQEAVVNCIREVGITNKITINVTRLNTKIRKEGRNDKLILGCGKGEKYKEGESLTQTITKKCGCPFR
jgi:hypothetical protein